LPQHVLQRAIEYLGQEEHDHSALLSKLNSRQLELEQELVLARRSRLEADAAQQLRKKQLHQLKERKQEILVRATRQADELIAATESRMKALRKRKPGPVLPQQAIDERQQLSAAREDLSPFKPKPKRSGVVPVQLKIGELVRIAALGVEAQVERLHGASIDLLVGGKRMRQPLDALEQFSPRRFVTISNGGGQVSRKMVDRQISPQLKLIGQRVDEALAQLERFIDDAMLHNLQQIEIIHGSGEGILRRAVREHLAGESGVTAFYAAPIAQGGDNITIAELSG
jgi:DNA mismatch repair protein MutS2